MILAMRFLFLFLVGASLAMATPTPLFQNTGHPISIHEAPDASESIKKITADFSSVLHRMTDKDFVTTSEGNLEGIIVGNIAQFPKAPGADKLDASDAMRREEYIIRTDRKHLWLIGATDAGTSHAMWDFLYRLGYRQYFPGEDWEIIPKFKEVAVDFDLLESPAYKVRNFAWHYGGDFQDARGAGDWLTKNRIAMPALFPDIFVLSTGHAYGGIIKQFREQFNEHPDMRSMINGKPTSKLNAANQLTQDVVRKYATIFFEKSPNATSISMDPSDGGGWGDSPEELAIGTPSDRALFLANIVAVSINKDAPHTRYVGMYAYNMHSPAPTKVEADPRVIISFATAFIKGGFTVPQLVEGWKKMGTKLFGLREYHSVTAWDLSGPTKSRSASLGYLAKTIPDYYNMGMRFYTTEAGRSWGPQGFGNFLTTRLLWNPKEANQTNAMLEEFVSNCFPEAKQPMLRFYKEYIHPPKTKLLTQDLIGRMYRTLQEARELTKDAMALQRIESLITYTRYCEFLYAYASRGGKPAEDQLEATKNLMAFAYRARKTGMLGSLAIYRDVPSRNRNLSFPKDVLFNIPEGKNPWKNSDPVTEDEINQWVEEGIKNNPLIDFEPVQFSQNLRPASELPSAAEYDTDQKPGNFGNAFRGSFPIYTWTTTPDQLIKFSGVAGITYTNLGDVTISLYPLNTDEAVAIGEENKEEKENTPVFLQATAEATLPPDKIAYDIALKAGREGSWIIKAQDRTGGYKMTKWSKDMPFAIEFSMEKVPTIIGRSALVFYVPKGTKKLGFYAQGRGTIMDSQGNVVFELPSQPGFYSVDIPHGMDGNFWRFSALVGGQIRLMTVPPYMATTASRLMLPAEVIEADLKK